MTEGIFLCACVGSIIILKARCPLLPQRIHLTALALQEKFPPPKYLQMQPEMQPEMRAAGLSGVETQPVIPWKPSVSCNILLQRAYTILRGKYNSVVQISHQPMMLILKTTKLFLSSSVKPVSSNSGSLTALTPFRMEFLPIALAALKH